MIVASIEVNPMVSNIELQRVPCMQWLMQFGQYLIETHINFGSKINTIQPSFARKLGLNIGEINVDIQRINGIKLEIFDMVIACFLVENKVGKSHFFEDTFLLGDISMNIACRMLLFIFNIVKMNFTDQELGWR